MKDFAAYFSAVQFLESLINLTSEKDYLQDRQHPEIYLQRMGYFLNLLGNPQNNFSFIHVGGTAGKGSTATMIHSILTEGGLRTGLFTSPFTTTSIEKIKVGQKYIAPGEFVHLVNYLKPHLDFAHKNSPDGTPSYFEFFFALALLYFQQKKCQWAVLEVGLGGKYDATNIIKKAEVTVITNINLDHTEILGKRLAQIAQDKAGIIKKGTYFLTAEKRKPILTFFKKITEKRKAIFPPLAKLYSDFKTGQKGISFKIKGFKKAFFLPLFGEFQAENATLAIKTAERLGVGEEKIRSGLAKIKIPCRFEIVQRAPLRVLDGAHNPVKIKSLLKILPHFSYRRLWLIIAVAASKDVKGILRQIIPLADQVFFTRFLIKERKCASPKKLAYLGKKFKKEGANFTVFLDPWAALKEAQQRAKRKDLILITGSFFLAGELRKKWFSEEQILLTQRSF